MIIQGKLLVDPTFEPEQGWVRIERDRIAEVAQGDPPDFGNEPPIGSPDHIITPAFYDAHTHLPQIDAIGCDGLPLLRWLNEVVYPAEQWWGRGAAISVARIAVRRMIREGTAGFAGYLTSHPETAHESLVWLATRTPMRFIAGRVCMDREAPDDLVAEDRRRSAMSPPPSPMMPPLADGSGRHSVSLNPRFAVSCSEELLAEVAWAWSASSERPAARPFIQTHLAESTDELARVRELFPDDPHYTGVYERLGLLTPKTLLAHAIHLSDDEWAAITRADSIVVHCPTANTFLQSGMFDLDAAERHSVRMALGSDVAGGPDLAMPRVARAMIEVAKHRRMAAGDDQFVRVPSPAEAWSLITRGNAELLGWPDAGRIEVGAAADLLVLGIPRVWHDDHLVGRLIYNWRSGFIEHRIINGILDPKISSER
ncbi:MAG: amidohydrolase family protein [Planctomycetota bacterium]